MNQIRSLMKKKMPSEKEINLKDIYSIIRRRLWIVILSIIILTTLAALYNSRPEPSVFVSSTRVIIVAPSDIMSTVRVMVREPIVLNKVIEELQLPESAGQIRGQIRVDSVESSYVTVISVADSDPDRAAEIANKTVDVFKAVAAETLNVSGIRVLTQAEPNSIPINESSNSIVFVAFFAGIVLGVGLTLLLDSLDDSLRSENEIEQLLDIAVLGQVIKIKRIKVINQSKKQNSALLRGETIGS